MKVKHFKAREALLVSTVRKALPTSQHANGKFTDVSVDARHYALADVSGTIALTETILSPIHGQT